MIHLSHGASRLDIDDRIGNLPHWQVADRAPLHRAPWRDEPEVQQDPAIPPVNKRLAGDFFCMPFGRDDVETGGTHGPPANTPWQVIATSESEARLRLDATVRGASIEKNLRIDDCVLYQTHTVTGGAGPLSFAHHPMTCMAKGGRLSVSPKRAVLTDPAPQYAGHNLWALDQMRDDFALDCATGGAWDLRDYPVDHAVEDFAILVEAPGRTLGWTVLMRHAENDMLVVLKDARLMPVTMLWVSNGGRDFPPWNSRHVGVLGIEDGCAAGATGLRASLSPNRLTAMGVPTARALGGTWCARHAMISLPRPAGWSEVTEIRLADGAATLTEVGGASLSVPFETDFFA